MSKKRYSQELEDADVQEIIPIPGEGDMKNFGGLIPQFEDNYQAIDIELTRKDLEKKASSVIKNVINVYYKFNEDGQEDDEIHQYLEQAKAIESMNLQNLLLQVKTSEHILYSLLGRLNATGSVDNGLYKLITDTQKESIALTMQVSNYVRSLPGYFKQLRFELETNIEMVKVEQTQEMIEQKSDDPDDFIKRPQKGMRNLLRELDAMESEMAKEKETIEDNINLPEKNYQKDEEIIEGLTEEELKRQLLAENEE